MIPIKKYSELTDSELDNLFNRFGQDFSSIMVETAVPIVNDVKSRGDAAVRHYTEKFDGVTLGSITASEAEIEEGYASTPKEIISALTRAKDNIEEFHSRQKRPNTIYTRDNGTTLGTIWHPIERAAVYAPGGKAAYPSSVLMGVIPAQIAGVSDITVVTPPMKDGRANPSVLAACRILGIRSIVKSGGAQGIAAAGLGTESVKKSHIIVGPGNIYVTAAKTYLFSLGLVQIDSMAGPSEVLIVADRSANPRWTAWDLLSQAEHDERAVAVLVTDSEEFALEVNRHIKEDIDSGRGRALIKKASLESSALTVITENIDQAVDFSNRYAPEHMQLLVSNPMEYLGALKNAGSIFLGAYSPVAAGDYFSGTNHILPTGGAARFSSGTSVDTFMRKSTFQHLTPEALRSMEKDISAISEAEGFGDKHGGSVRVRFE